MSESSDEMGSVFPDEDPDEDPNEDPNDSYSSEDEVKPIRPASFQHFAPPYYGRPPTPLPTSPSLTSLLRPSRPTTPDASDDELEPVPRASPRVPTYEYYGFVLYLFSSAAFVMYLLWSYLPSPFLHVLGIYYYPNRWWSLAIPSFLVMLLVYVYVALALYNAEMLTRPLSSVEVVVDDAAKVAVIDGKGRIRTDPRRRPREVELAPGVELDWAAVWSVATDAVLDVPLSGVCEVLYGDGRRHESLEDGEL